MDLRPAVLREMVSIVGKYLFPFFWISYGGALVGWYALLRDWSAIPIASPRFAIIMCIVLPLSSALVLVICALCVSAYDQPDRHRSDASESGSERASGKETGASPPTFENQNEGE